MQNIILNVRVKNAFNSIDNVFFKCFKIDEASVALIKLYE